MNSAPTRWKFSGGGGEEEAPGRGSSTSSRDAKLADELERITHTGGGVKERCRIERLSQSQSIYFFTCSETKAGDIEKVKGERRPVKERKLQSIRVSATSKQCHHGVDAVSAKNHSTISLRVCLSRYTSTYAQCLKLIVSISAVTN